ncbi:hypothetical protein PT974_04276 [Cladobotryum mycophilum]|uniref:Uncharacterized protein n=1 Tax=Cladobotryum mycophilum TaxID=491253 RepID=A0ABR0SUM5_9HYPO
MSLHRPRGGAQMQTHPSTLPLPLAWDTIQTDNTFSFADRQRGLDHHTPRAVVGLSTCVSIPSHADTTAPRGSKRWAALLALESSNWAICSSFEVFWGKASLFA